MNKFLLYVSVAASVGGFLFGFDSGVISGAEKAIQAEFGLSAFWHGLVVSVALIGTLFGVFLAGKPSDRFGRRPTLWAMAVLFLVSALGYGSASSAGLPLAAFPSSFPCTSWKSRPAGGADCLWD